MGTIGKVTAGGSTHLIASTAYAVCETSASIAAKVATIQDNQAFTLMEGVTIHVYFIYSNTASNPTLNVNSTGAKSIYAYDLNSPGRDRFSGWEEGSILTLTYSTRNDSNGYWMINNYTNQYVTSVNSQVGDVQLDYSDVGAASTGHTHTYSAVGAASAAHVHGNITSAGDITATATIASGDRLVINDESASKITNSTITFGSSVNSFLANNGTWQDASKIAILEPDYHTSPATISLAEITTALASGKIVYLDITDGDRYFMPLVSYTSDSYAQFGGIYRDSDNDETTYVELYVDSDGAYDGPYVYQLNHHSHGAISSEGSINYQSGVDTIGSGDSLVFTDSSDSNKIKKSSIAFGSATNSYLANNGTWQGIPGSKVTINSTTYDIASQTKTSVSGVTGLLITPDTTDANVDPIFLPDGNSMQSAVNTIIAAIPSTYSDVGAASASHTHAASAITFSSQRLDATDVQNAIEEVDARIDTIQVNSDWTATAGVSSILNKPSIPSTYSDVGAASAAHVHGSITSDGKITDTGITIGSGDALVVTDSSASNAIKKTSITFGTSTTSFLANNGTWQTPSGGSGTSVEEILIVTYGDSSTTSTQLATAIQAGKAIFCRVDEDPDFQLLPLNFYNIEDDIYCWGSMGVQQDGGQYYCYWALWYEGSWDSSGTDNPALSDTITSWYGTSSTAASTAAKVITCNNYVLKAGNIIGVLFTTANTAATPTLNVNSTGAKTIYVGNATTNATTNVLKWSANTMIYFMYDGTNYRYMYSMAAASATQPRGANTWYGTSSTAATTQAKVSTIDNFVLTKGALVTVYFSTSNTYTSAKITLNINATGAKDIYYKNAVTSSTNTCIWGAGTTITFIYDGTYYRILSSCPDIELRNFSVTDISYQTRVTQDVSNVGEALDYFFEDQTAFDIPFTPNDQNLQDQMYAFGAGYGIEAVWNWVDHSHECIQVTYSGEDITISSSGFIFVPFDTIQYQASDNINTLSLDSTGGVHCSVAGWYEVSGGIYGGGTTNTLSTTTVNSGGYRRGIYVYAGTSASNDSAYTQEWGSNLQYNVASTGIQLSTQAIYVPQGHNIYLALRCLSQGGTLSGNKGKATFLYVKRLPSGTAATLPLS